MKIAGLPDISLMTDFVPNETAFNDRVVVYHAPTGSVAEVVNPETKIKHYDGPRRQFRAPGAAHTLTFVLLRGSEETADQVFDALEQAHHRFDFWAKTEGLYGK